MRAFDIDQGARSTISVGLIALVSGLGPLALGCSSSSSGGGPLDGGTATGSVTTGVGSGGASTGTGSATGAGGSTTGATTSTTGAGGSTGTTTSAGAGGSTTGATTSTTGAGGSTTGATTSTTGAGGSTSTTTTTGTGTGGAGGGGCAEESVAGNAGCGAGQVCRFTSCMPSPQFACVTPGSGKVGGACSTSGDCGTGLSCAGYTPTVRVCEAQCVSDSDCPSQHCARLSGCMGAVAIGICGRACSDTSAAGAAACGAGFKCDGICFGTTVSNLCLPAGPGRAGATCMSVSDCAAGLTCVSDGTAAKCVQLCQADTDCAQGKCTGGLACNGVASGSKFCN